MDRLLQCATHALPYFSASVSSFLKCINNCKSPANSHSWFKVPSTAFAEYLICKVLPHYYQLSDIPGADTK